ncbi:MAG: hypothetical protein RJA09_2358 [Pseudomonadota bacterium]
MSTAASPWQQGWLGSVAHTPSPNQGARPSNAQIDLLVIHSISLPPGVFGGRHIDALFTNTLDWDAHPYFQQIRGLEVSAHFVIRRSGEVVQFVSCDRRAWHAGRSVWRGRDNCNNDSIGIELEGLEGGSFEAAQYQSLLPLCQAIGRHYPIGHLAGHEHIAPGRKGDPGAGFDWNRLSQGLGWHAACFPPQGKP